MPLWRENGRRFIHFIILSSNPNVPLMNLQYYLASQMLKRESALGSMLAKAQIWKLSCPT